MGSGDGHCVGHGGEEPRGDTPGLSPTAFPPGGWAGPAVPSAPRRWQPCPPLPLCPLAAAQCFVPTSGSLLPSGRGRRRVVRLQTETGTYFNFTLLFS